LVKREAAGATEKAPVSAQAARAKRQTTEAREEGNMATKDLNRSNWIHGRDDFPDDSKERVMDLRSESQITTSSQPRRKGGMMAAISDVGSSDTAGRIVRDRE
jgi:hypothetical protein